MHAMFEYIHQSVNVTSVLVFFAVFLVVHYITKKTAGVPPCPTPVLPFLGNLLHLLVNTDALEYFRRLRDKYGDVFSLYMGSQLIIVINGYTTIKEALVQNGRVFSNRPKNFLTEMLTGDYGILCTSGEKWKEHRRFAMNALQELGFGRSSFEQNIIEEAKELINIIEEQNCRPFQMKGIVNTCVSNIISQIVFGKRFKHTDTNFMKFLNKLDEAARLVANTSVLVNCFPFLQYLPGDPMKMRLLQRYQREFDIWYEEMLNEHKNTYKEGEARDYIDFYISEARRRENSGTPSTFTDTQLYTVIRDLFGGGSETSATSIIWALLHFLHFPEIQRNCFDELDRVIGRDRSPSLKDKDHMPYLEATILEVLRVYPVIPLPMPHAVSQDVLFHGYHIPQGTTIIVNLDSVLRDPVIFKDPEKFRPERYLDVDGRLNKPLEHIAFSLGRRFCPGESVARMELFLFLAALIQNFEFLPVEGKQLPELKGILGITLSPAPFLIRAIKRV
ncbi:hypothetical protein CHS0354_020355 [Potamilus streckersoni]|uniref:Cytochrome P450 n=1 Tax=Potamilus streckersoni TaxID=2493646 RepID=A0AAE0SFK6_9BIVA|nr:hypothetical protein CHS0354_020355 [Potamilus streckersoni]